MSNADMLGDAVNAAMTASAVEPRAGNSPNSADEAGDNGHTHETACLNCGTALLGGYCHACGQHAHVHRTLGAFFHDLLHGVFHFEGKIWTTLPMLALHPGELTRRYIDGQRARFVSPLALFLFCVFLMFTVLHQTANEAESAEAPHATVTMKDATRIADAQKQLATLEQQRATLARSGADTDDADEDIAAARASLLALQSGKAGGAIKAMPSTGFSMLDNAIQHVGENPGLAMYKMETHAYKYSWALIPISVPFLWLLFPFSRRFHLYDHTVFVTYSLCFMTLLLVLGMVAEAVGLSLIAALCWLVPPAHMYRQLRGAYGCSRRTAMLRTMALAIFAFIALSLFVSLIAAETTAG